LGEILDVDGVGNGLATGQDLRFSGRLEQLVEQGGFYALHQMLEVRDGGGQHAGVGPGEVAAFAEQFLCDAAGEHRQHRSAHDRQRLEAGQCPRADVLQPGAGFVVGRLDAFGKHPRLGRVEGLVDDVGLRHDATDRPAVFAVFEVGAHLVRYIGELCLHGFGIADIRQLAIEQLGDEVGGAAGDVYVLADQVAVDPCHEVVGIEIQVFNV